MGPDGAFAHSYFTLSARRSLSMLEIKFNQLRESEARRETLKHRW